MTAVGWLLDGTAEWVVAFRENRMLGQISRHAWLVAALYVAIAITLLVAVV